MKQDVDKPIWTVNVWSLVVVHLQSEVKQVRMKINRYEQLMLMFLHFYDFFHCFFLWYFGIQCCILCCVSKGGTSMHLILDMQLQHVESSLCCSYIDDNLDFRLPLAIFLLLTMPLKFNMWHSTCEENDDFFNHVFNH